MKQLALSAVLLVVLLPAVTFAWGGDGYQLVCLIAEDRLTAAAKAKIHELLGKDVNISDAHVASWADEVRRSRNQTGPWHYVDIPTDAKAFDKKRDGNDGNNVIDKITDFENVLKDPKATKTDQAEALKYLVHLVGDLHQPLHCAERNKDKGGNAVSVAFLDSPRRMNLHSVWDSAILLNHKGTVRNADYADKLNAAISPEQAAESAKGTPTDWANESHDIAVAVVYKDVPETGAKIDQKYVDAAGPVIDQQLQRGGVRLAAILNEVLKDQPATQPTPK